MYGCKSWTIKKTEHWRTDAFELWCWRRLKSPLDSKEIKLVNPKTSTLNIHWKNWYWSWSSNTWVSWCKEPTHWKRPWCWERMKTGGEASTEDEMAGWHHWLNGHEFEQTLEDSEGQGRLPCCSSWSHNTHDMESDTTLWLNNSNRCKDTAPCQEKKTKQLLTQSCLRRAEWTLLLGLHFF